MRTGRRAVRSGLRLAASATLVVVGTSLVGDAAGQVLYESPIVTVGIQPESTVAGDLTGDGRTDLVVALTSHAYVVVLQTADGWAPAAPVTTGGNLAHLALGDLDGDGHLDLVDAVDAPGNPKLDVRFGDGTGAFGAPVTNHPSPGPFDVDLADLDGDGDLDVIVACVPSARVSILLNAGDGSLLPKADYAAGADPLNTAVGDWNGDGAPDLAFSNNAAVAAGQAVTVLLNAGDGSFGAPASIPMPARPWDIETGDFDGDGVPDLCVTPGAPGELLLLHGNGDGSFEAPVVKAATYSAFTLGVADFNEDGVSDIAMGSEDDSTHAVGALVSRGTAGNLDPLALYGTYGRAVEVLAQDVTDDGDVDLVVCCGELGFPFLTSRVIMVLEGRGDGSFGPTAGVLGIDTPELAFGDLNGDGRPDLVAASVDNILSVIPGTGLGGFDGARPLHTPTFMDSARTIALADFDGDDDLDLAAGTFASGVDRIDLYRGKGDFTFAAPESVILPAAPGDLTATDIDGDGDVDLLHLSFQTSQAALHVRLNDGTGHFAAALVTPAPWSDRLAVGDLTGDGILDAVVHSQLGPQLLVFPGNGDGTMQAPLSLLLDASNESGLATGDADGDGDVDVLLAEAGSSFIHLHLNSGGGVLAAPVLVPVGPGVDPVGAVIADLDRDGYADLATACSITIPDTDLGAIIVRRGLGEGNFAPPDAFPIPIEPLALEAHDVDGDGWIDLAVVNTREAVTVLLNKLGPWHTLGHPLAGSLGLPRLTGEGTLLAGEPFRITLTDSLPAASVALVLGTGEGNTPFKGGVLVPLPQFVLFPLPTNAKGDLALTGSWPPGASGLTLRFQDWLQDPAGLAAYAASNGLAGEVP